MREAKGLGMRYLSVCSGIEAATVAWQPLGWRPVAFSEIEAFPSAVLAHHYPDVPNLGDMTNFRSWPDAAIDLLVGGTPCQSFSVAGLRKGLDDPRGNLALTYLAIAERYRPRWLVWENVPGVLSSNGGRDFGTFLGGLGQLGYGWAYRVLDAQYFGVAQRRRRVFVVGHLGDWRAAAAVLFERHSLSGHPAPRREAGKGASADVAPSLTASGRGVERTGETRGQDPVVAVCLNAKGGAGRMDAESETFIAHTLRGEGFDASEDGTGRGTPLAPVAFAQNSRNEVRLEGGDGQRCGALSTGGGKPGQGVPMIIAFHPTQDPISSADGSTHALGCGATGGQASVAVALRGRDGGATAEVGDDCAFSLRASTGGGDKPHVMVGMAVRRLTPRECERLQGFPDDYTRIPWRGKPAELCPDGPRYKALGNSMAVPVMRWIGERIKQVHEIANN